MKKNKIITISRKEWIDGNLSWIVFINGSKTGEFHSLSEAEKSANFFAKELDGFYDKNVGLTLEMF